MPEIVTLKRLPEPYLLKILSKQSSTEWRPSKTTLSKKLNLKTVQTFQFNCLLIAETSAKMSLFKERRSNYNLH